jgi:hypothetical protein
MAEVLVQFDTALPAPNGRSYVPRACGRVMEDGSRWEGWIEFVPDAGDPVLRTPRETVQPNRQQLRYWATGLTTTYLEGALERALSPPPAVPVTEPVRPIYDGPAPSTVHVSSASTSPVRSGAVLDPFRVYAQGEAVLRQELGALNSSHLRAIAQAYNLADEAALEPRQMSRAELADLIVAAVRKRTE